MDNIFLKLFYSKKKLSFTITNAEKLLSNGVLRMALTIIMFIYKYRQFL